jgi:hypothetical protein
VVGNVTQSYIYLLCYFSIGVSKHHLQVGILSTWHLYHVVDTYRKNGARSPPPVELVIMPQVQSKHKLCTNIHYKMEIGFNSTVLSQKKHRKGSHRLGTKISTKVAQKHI